MASRLPKPLVAVLLAALSLAIAPAAASAVPGTIQVNSTSDAADPTPADGTCDDGAGHCTLRAAVQTANASPGADTIHLPANTDPYALSVSGNDTGGSPNAAVGDLDITGDVTITGDGQDTTKIGGSGVGNRVFDIQSSATATISGVTIMGGHANNSDPVDVHNPIAGGGIRVAGTLALTDSTLTKNRATAGGGVATDAPGASMTLTRVTVTDNGTDGVTRGGGIAQLIGSVTIQGSTITGNHGQFGVGVDQEALGGADGVMTITDSLIADNLAVGGEPSGAPGRVTLTGTMAGGIVETGGGHVTLTRTEVRGNTSNFGGGVVEDGAGVIDIVDSWIHDNSATRSRSTDGGGGGILNDAGGAINLLRSTVSANHADVDGGGFLDVGAGATSIVNSTFTANSVGTSQLFGSGAGISLEGGSGGTLSADSSTIHDNTVVTPTQINSPTRGQSKPVVDLDNCFTTPDCSNDPEAVTVRGSIIGSDSPACGGPITSLGFNLGSDDTCLFHAAGDKVNTDPKLGPLAANGGPTMTMALLSGSPAIDAAGTAGCQSTDQRGIARPQGPACDIGAYEVEVPKPATVAPSATVTPSKKLKSCTSRRNFRIRVRKRHGIKIVSATIRVNGHTVRVLTGKRLRAPVDLRRLPKGTFTVSITARTSRGRILRAHRTYHTCIPRLPRGRLPAL